jgi:trehalose 6-phosphate phosphatase
MTAHLLADPAGRRALQLAARACWLLAFDFDGTLAPFVADPADAIIPAGIHADLATLAMRRSVVVITGRARADVLPRLPPGIAHVVGNHGGEMSDGDPHLLAAAQDTARHWRETLQAMMAGSGLRLEAKGLSLALHWRGHDDPQRAAELAAHWAMHLVPRPHLVAGHQVLNLLPIGLPDKGTALLRLLDITGCAGALFVGDDITDATIFSLRDPGIVGVEIGDQALGADWRLDGLADVAALLRDLVGFTAPG